MNFARLIKYLGTKNSSTPYDTTLSPSDELGFRVWAERNSVPLSKDYDMRGFYKDPNAQSSVNPVDNKLHFPDTYKTPLHQSFSSESKYATPDAPSWDGNKLVKPDGSVIFLELPPGFNNYK